MNLLSTYDRFRQAYPAQGAFSAYREAAYNFVNGKGLPSKTDEDWHYTNVKVLKDASYMPSVYDSKSINPELRGDILRKLNPEFTNLVFFNGVLNKELSDEFPPGVVLKEFSQFSERFVDAFDALNGAYQVTPYAIEVLPSKILSRPLNFIFYSGISDGVALMSHPRVQIEIGSRSSVVLLESYYGTETQAYFLNSVLSMHISDSAKVTYVRLQGDSENGINIGRSQINLGANSHLEFLAFAAGAKLSRHSFDLTLSGSGASAEVLGVYALSENQHLDNTTVIDHLVGGCQSNQLYKGILGGESRGVFCGKVIIQKGAQGANSSQLNNNLLLSSKAEADSKPNLEIYADDVKASHGSTVGQLNQDEVFYLQSRGISRSEAIRMLSQGFLLGVIYKISDERLQKWLISHLQEAFTRIGRGGALR